MKFRKFRKNVKAISPVISVLLMIAVAVVASLVAYAWVMGYIGFQTAKTGQAIQIQSVSYAGSGSEFTVYVQNIGDSDVKLQDSASPNNCLYINGALATNAGTISTDPLEKGDTVGLTGTATGLTAGVQEITFKVTTTGGTFSQVTQQFTIATP
jgi:flagellin-like protein